MIGGKHFFFLLFAEGGNCKTRKPTATQKNRLRQSVITDSSGKFAKPFETDFNSCCAQRLKVGHKADGCKK